MSKYNLGIVKTSLLSNLNETATVKQFVGVLKESELLKLEFTIFENIENAYIQNEDLAIKYIDENIKLMKDAGYTKENFDQENKKFLPIMEGIQFSSTGKKDLYEKIHTMIQESLTGKKVTNVNKLHDSFTYVLEFVKNNNKTIVETIVLPDVLKEVGANDFIVKKSIQEFNDKYTALLSEDEMSIFKSMINQGAKESTFNLIKENTVSALNSYLSDMKIKSNEVDNVSIQEQRELDQDIDKVKSTISNIKKKPFNESTYMNDVLDLVSLKNDLL